MKKRLILIILVVTLTIIVVAVPWRRNYERVKYAKSFKRFDAIDFNDRIKSATDFYKDFSEEYMRLLKDSFPNFTLIDSLPVGDPTKAKLTLYLSTTEETMLKLDRGYPDLTIHATQYPVQLALGFGLDLNYDNREIPYNPALLDVFGTSCALRAYVDTPGYFRHTTIYDFITNIFCLYDNILIMTAKLSYGGTVPNVSSGNFTADGLAFWTSLNGFQYHKHRAKQTAKKAVFYDLRDMFVRSEFFKNALKNQILSPIAIRIVDKSKDKQNGFLIEYDQTEYFKDQEELINKSRLFGLDSIYAKELIQFTQTHFFSGKLFKKYYSQSGFMVQWAIVNFIFLVIAVILKKRGKTDKVLLQITTFRLSPFGSFVIASNGYIFLDRAPNDFDLFYAIIPTAILGLIVWVTLFDFQKRKMNWSRF